MQKMTHRERVLNSLNKEPVDLLPCHDGLWGETTRKYTDEGHMQEGEDYILHFDTSIRTGGWLNSTADIDKEPEVIDEDEESVLRLDGNGAQLRYWKGRSGTPEHVDFMVKDRAAWEEHIKPLLANVDRRRIPFESYRKQRRTSAESDRAFGWSGVAPFEQMHPVCGHEYMLMGMALDPEWVKDMAMTYAEFTIKHLEILFAEEGTPDFAWFYEDMGFKNKPFMSPDMYREIIQPAHKRLFDYAHSHDLKVIVHSCGFVEPLVGGMIEAGVDCLQAMEVKAGMDMPRLAEMYGDRISFCGNLDIRIVASNDKQAIDDELTRKIYPVLDKGAGFIVHSDHSIPPEVEHDTLHYFFDRGRTTIQRWREERGIE